MASAGLARSATNLLGSPWVERVALAATPSRLRILAYHGIPDPDAFARQLDHLVEHYRPVSGGDVMHALAGAGRLPHRAVWINFDDGRPEVVTAGLPRLVERGISATMFVCPGVVDTQQPFWWDTVARAAEHECVPTEVSTRVPPGRRLDTWLKSVPDEERRTIVADLYERLGEAGVDDAAAQLSSTQLRVWADAGMEIANHTWDHPCLDRCSDEEQVRQIERAHESIATIASASAQTFAYPNGNFTTVARDTIARLRYTMAVDFSHRLCRRSSDPLELPRLRIDSDASLDRFRAIVSGVHPALFHARSHLRPNGDGGR